MPKLSPEHKPTCTVCLYHEGLAESFAKFREVFWPQAGSAGNKLKESNEPFGSIDHAKNHQSRPTFLFLRNSEVLGHISSLPMKVWFKGKWTSAYWVVGFMVLPEYRGGPVGVSIIKKVNETLPLAMTLTVEQAPLRIFKGLGWTHLGIIPQYLLVLSPRKILKNINIDQVIGSRRQQRGLFRMLIGGFRYSIIRESAAGICWASFHILGWRKLFAILGRIDLRIEEDSGFNEGYNDLWERLKHMYPALVVRDQAYLSARYGSRPDKYKILSCMKAGRLEGFLVFSMKQFNEDPRMGNCRVGTIIDCLFDPVHEEVFRNLVAKAIQIFQDERIDAVLCTASYGPLRMLLRRYGFVGIPGNLNFVFHDKSGTSVTGVGLDSWHLMRGDCDADGNF